MTITIKQNRKNVEINYVSVECLAEVPGIDGGGYKMEEHRFTDGYDFLGFIGLTGEPIFLGSSGYVRERDNTNKSGQYIIGYNAFLLNEDMEYDADATKQASGLAPYIDKIKPL